MTPEPVVVGLAGAGPWASMVHAPVLAAGPETRLAGVWARRADAADELAARHGARPCRSFGELLDNCEAVAFAVPPAVQQPLAVDAARAGKAVLLEKPIAASLDGARLLADEVGHAGVGSLVVLTARFAANVRDFLDRAATIEPFGGYVLNASGAFLEGPFSHSPWRHERGALLDIGPHAVDLLSASLGIVTDVDARASRRWVQLSLGHTGGACSTALLSCHVPDVRRRELEIFGANGTLRVDDAPDPATFATLRREFADVARTGASHACDVHRGLYLQEVLDLAERQLSRS